MNEPVLENILASPGPAVLWGPAGSGKTSVAFDFYRRFATGLGASRCLFLAPNAVAAGRFRRRLLDESPSGVVVGPEVATFAALAGRILAATGHTGRLLPTFARRLLIERIVHDLAQGGKLPLLGKLTDTPGLTQALDRAIAELKRAAGRPEDLGEAGVGRTGKVAELLAVYRRYQEHLRANDLYDLEGQMWQALECLEQADPCDPVGLEGLEAIVVDGFTDFTPTELGILSLTSKRVGRMLITLPLAVDQRETLWSWTRRTRDRLGEALGSDLREICLASSAETQGPALRSLWETAFDLEATGRELPEGLHIIRAAGMDAEVAAVARKVKKLLAEGSPAGSIAVLARSMDAYRPAVERIFAAHDIAIAPAPRSLREAPAVGFLLNVAALGPDYRYAHALRVIKSSYFRPGVLGAYSRETVVAAETLIRQGNVFQGRQAYAQAAQIMLDRLQRQADENEESTAPGPSLTVEGVAAALEMLERLFELSEPQGRPPAKHLLDLLGKLELIDAVCGLGEPALIARDLRTLEKLQDILRRWGDELTAFASLDRLLATVASPSERKAGIVDVLDVLDARAVRYEHVFCLGLSEGQFPLRQGETALIGDGDRQKWTEAGWPLDSRRDLMAREMLLFYLTISRADKGLTLSYPFADAGGHPMAPSSFLLSALEPFGGLEAIERLGRIQQIDQGELFPADEELATPNDALNAAVAGLFAEAPGRGRQGLAWATKERPKRIDRLSRGLWAYRRRWQPGPCDRFDGGISAPDLARRLAQRFGGEAVFSASQLNAYGQCPWSFFGRYVLGLEPLAEPTRRLEPISRGLFCHAVLFDLMHRLRRRHGTPFRLQDVPKEQLAHTLDQAIEKQQESWAARSPSHCGLWRIELTQMKSHLRQYLESQRASDALGGESLHFELSFGGAGGKGEGIDPASTAEPVDVALPGGRLRLAGKIDRIDRISFGDETGLLIIDYKTGALPTLSDVRAGRNVQLPLYAAAAEALLGQECLGGSFHLIGPNEGRQRVFARFKKHGHSYRVDRKYAEHLDEAMRSIAKSVEGIRRGRFDVLPTHDCPNYCPFRRICQYVPVRAKIKESVPPREDRA